MTEVTDTTQRDPVPADEQPQKPADIPEDEEIGEGQPRPTDEPDEGAEQ